MFCLGTGFGAQPTSFGFGGQQSNQQGTGHAKFAATTGHNKASLGRHTIKRFFRGRTTKRGRGS